MFLGWPSIRFLQTKLIGRKLLLPGGGAYIAKVKKTKQVSDSRAIMALLFNLPAGKHILSVKKNGNEVVVTIDRLSETLVYMKVCPDVSECIALMPSRQGHAIFK